MPTLDVTVPLLGNGFRRYYELATCCHDWHRAPIRSVNSLRRRSAWKIEQSIENMISIFGVAFSKTRDDIRRDHEAFCRYIHSQMVRSTCNV